MHLSVETCVQPCSSAALQLRQKMRENGQETLAAIQVRGSRARSDARLSVLDVRWESKKAAF
jgi:hypothetical protein